MTVEIEGVPLKEAILDSARGGMKGFDKKTLQELEELCIPPIK